MCKDTRNARFNQTCMELARRNDDELIDDLQHWLFGSETVRRIHGWICRRYQFIDHHYNDELLQDSALKFIVQLRKGGVRTPAALLVKIMKHCAFDLKKKEQKRKSRETSLESIGERQLEITEANGRESEKTTCFIEYSGKRLEVSTGDLNDALFLLGKRDDSWREMLLAVVNGDTIQEAGKCVGLKPHQAYRVFDRAKRELFTILAQGQG